MSVLRVVLNVVWLVFAGVPLGLAYLLAGVVCCVLVVTIPWGIGAFRIAGYVFWPFGRTAVRRHDAGAGSAAGNVVWVLVAGIWLAIGHVVSAAALAVTIIGIPLAVAELKIIPITLTPLGRRIVPSDQAFASYGRAGRL